MSDRTAKARARFIAAARKTASHLHNFTVRAHDAKAAKARYLADKTTHNRNEYRKAKKIRAQRLRVYRRSRVKRNALKVVYLASKRLDHEPLRLRALRIARDIEASGVSEKGGNNVGPDVSPLIREGGGIPGQALCGWFCAVAYKRAGSKLVTWHWGAVRLLSVVPGVGVTRYPRAGYLVRYTFDHVGVFWHYCDANGNKVKQSQATHIKAVEGNTGSSGAVSDSSSGTDGVKVKIRHRSLVRDYINIPR